MEDNHIVDGKCEICSEPIVKGDITKYKDGKYLCAMCQIYLNRKMDLIEILYKRKEELLNQIGEIEVELKKLENKKDLCIVCDKPITPHDAVYDGKCSDCRGQKGYK